MQQEAAGFILYRDDVHYLLLHSRRNQEWGFPKGHREPEDPDLHTTALRELAEETGIEASEVSVDPDFENMLEYLVKEGARGLPPYNKRVVYLLAECRADAKISLSEEHDRFQWCDLDQARSMLPFPELVDCLEKADAHRKQKS